MIGPPRRVHALVLYAAKARNRSQTGQKGRVQRTDTSEIMKRKVEWPRESNPYAISPVLSLCLE